MQIPYRRFEEYKPVDVSKMRPQGSYKNLINKRTAAVEELIVQYGKIPAEMLHRRPCPNCGGGEDKKIIEKDSLDIVACSRCGLVFVNPVFDEAFYKKMYASSSQQEILKQLHEDSHEYRVERFGRERVEIIKRFIKKEPVSLLDVGCSSGFVVEAARKAGWDARGIDLNPSAIAFGKKRGLNLIEGDIYHPALEQQFDVICFFDILEHLIDPRMIMQKALSMLAPGGIIFLYLPNFDSAIIKLLGSETHIIRPSHHLTYFTPTTAEDFLRSLDLEVEYMVTEGLDITDYIWRMEEMEGKNMEALKTIQDQLQFFINAGCYGVNLRIIARKK